MLGVIATEATLFAVLVAAYFYLRFQAVTGWPPEGIEQPSIRGPLLATALLVLTSVTVVQGQRSSGRQARSWLAATIVLGAIFLALQAILIDDSRSEFRPEDSAYGSIVYTLTGLHWVHVAAGLVLALWAVMRTWLGPEPWTPIAVTALYWHFTNTVAVALFLVVTVSPHL
jgi:heme/copper-type cytochrome/quinol oxidase subunit 3